MSNNLIISNEMRFSMKSCHYHIHSVRGQSGFFFNLGLTERNKQFKFDFKLSVNSLGVWKFQLYLLNLILVSTASKRKGAKIKLIVGF